MPNLDGIDQDEQLAIVAALYRLRRAEKIPPVWVDGFKLRIETGENIIRPMSWKQARRLVDGEPLNSVLRTANKPPAAPHDWDEWRSRRSEYLRETGKEQENELCHTE